MKIINASAKIIDDLDGAAILRKIERCGRICYKSEGNITEDSAERFVRNLIKSGHESVLEHVSFSALIVCDRGVSHEIVRHRIASYSQESTRFCNYSKDGFENEITVIKPFFFDDRTDIRYKNWHDACYNAEYCYREMIYFGCKPQEARSVLPNSLKTELIMTANLREWRHFLKLRTAKDAHPQMREVSLMLLGEAHMRIPVVFDDIFESVGGV